MEVDKIEFSYRIVRSQGIREEARKAKAAFIEASSRCKTAIYVNRAALDGLVAPSIERGICFD